MFRYPMRARLSMPETTSSTVMTVFQLTSFGKDGGFQAGISQITGSDQCRGTAADEGDIKFQTVDELFAEFADDCS